ncbi:hypothetical protein PPYR_09392 [Photinus pyralis]|nr:short-chain dehydrogenase/reductase family 16C member 6-like isoform X1 [Photinus pyralis]KAB0798399.1 hypothetical protein PPYR_09392 [Photinus pyralis]
MIATLLFILKALLAMTKALYRYIIPKSKKSVNGETVLVTGAGDGIGKEVALIYASAGATVVCIDINAEANEETIRTIANLGYAKAYAYTCDVSDYQQVVFIINKIEQEVGNVTILVNNAGILFGNPFCELSATEIEKMIQVNLMSHFWTVKAILPSMLKNNYGHIVSVASIFTIISMPYFVPYSASKFAVQGFIDGLQNELALNKNNKIRTTLIHPCITNTALRRGANATFSSLIPVFNPKDVAAGIVNAQRRDMVEAAIPWGLHLTLRSFLRLCPAEVVQLAYEYFQVKLNPHK